MMYKNNYYKTTHNYPWKTHSVKLFGGVSRVDKISIEMWQKKHFHTVANPNDPFYLVSLTVKNSLIKVILFHLQKNPPHYIP